MLKNKRVLFVGSSTEITTLLGQAWAAGVIPCLTDLNPDCAGIRWCKKHNTPWGIADTYDPEATLAEAIHFDLDGVVAMGTDVGPTVAWVAARLGLPHIPYGTTRLGWNKPALKILLAGSGIRTSREIRVPAQYPVVVKPAYRGRGARGVRLVRDRAGLDEAQADARQYCVEGCALVEEYLPGPQISVEAIVWGGECVFIGMTDRDYDLKVTGDRFIELGGWGPSCYEGTGTGEAIKEVTRRVVKALEIEAGTIKLDVVFGDEPAVIECAIGRVGGGYNILYWQLCYGVRFTEAVLAVACGLDPTPLLEPGEKQYCRGVYRSAAGALMHPERGRFYLAIGKSREEAERKARQWQKS